MDQSSKDRLNAQLQRLRMDSDLRFMVESGVIRITDEEAAEFSERLRTASDTIIAVINDLIKDKGIVS